MKIEFVFCVSYLCLCKTNSLITNIRKINWNILAVHKEIDISIVHSTKHSETIIHCASLCSHQKAIHRESFYFIQETDVCYCNSEEDLKPSNTSSNLLQYGTPIIDNSDCLSLYEYGYETDGVYSITGGLGNVLYAKCDMTNGGWTIIQQRIDGSEDFERNWSDYAVGFGDVYGEYWIGLDNIHYLTTSKSELAVYMEVFPGVTPANISALYSHFTIGDSTSKYILDVDGYTGTCGDSITQQNGMKFTTFDNDNDLFPVNCAVKFKCGWWHKGCFYSSFNGLYFQAGEYDSTNWFAQGLHWFTCWEFEYSAKTTIMKVRRN